MSDTTWAEWILEKPRCPECDAQPAGTVEHIRNCVALLTPVTDDPGCNAFDYQGETRVNWDGQEADVVEVNGVEEVQLECPAGHTWRSPFTAAGDVQ